VLEGSNRVILLDRDGVLNVDRVNSVRTVADLDVEIGLNAGVRTILVETGYGRDHAKTLKRMPDRIAANLLEAARYITKRS